jgi:hypothetical protein
MKNKHLSAITLLAMILVSLPVVIFAQGQPADYERSANLSGSRKHPVSGTASRLRAGMSLML